MSPLDSGFFHLEDGHSYLHIGCVCVFEGPVPSSDDVLDLYRRKLPLIPRYRQRMRRVPFALGRPVWIDDEQFMLSHHVRRHCLPPPGTDAQLVELADRFMSRPLDPERPLWETWVVEGLEDGRWAMLVKLHHSMVDGLAGLDLLSTVLDEEPHAVRLGSVPWLPEAGPTALQLASSAVADLARTPARALRGAVAAARHPRRTAFVTAAVARGVAGYASALRPVRPTTLIGRLGVARDMRWLTLDLGDVLAVRAALGGSVNDVVLAAVSRGFRDLLISRGERPADHAVRTLVPVSVRPADQRGRVGNRVSAILAELPVEFAEPLDAYRAVGARMRQLKASHEAEAGELVTELADFVPPSLLASLLHIAFRVPQRSLTTVVTNVPGSRRPLFAAGRRMLAIYPYVPIADRLRIGVAVTSYGSQLSIGVTCDRDSVPDIDVLSAGIADGMTELLKVAQAADNSADNGAESGAGNSAGNGARDISAKRSEEGQQWHANG